MTQTDLLLDLLAALVREPDRLVKVHEVRHRPGLMRVSAHAHDDWLQLDLALDCGGAWCVDGRHLPVRGTTAAAFYPRQVHAYELQMTAASRVLSAKLRVDRTWPAIRRHGLAPHTPDMTRARPLVEAFERLIRLSLSSRRSVPLLVHRVVGLFTLWPVAGEGPACHTAYDHTDATVEAAMDYLDQRLDRRVALGDLARVVHMSPRHLTRRFDEAIGLTPLAYADRRRLALAGDMLRHGEANVTQIAGQLGFATIHAFSRWFRRHTGVAPTHFARRHGSL